MGESSIQTMSIKLVDYVSSEIFIFHLGAFGDLQRTFILT